MRIYKKLSLISLILLFSFPIANALAFVHIDRLNNSGSIFFLANLKPGETIQISLKPNGGGKFGIFLFNERPTDTNVNIDRTLNQKIFKNAVAYSLSANPTIAYKAPKETIYYVQVILISNGPDDFILTCNKELSRYYLPQIPGFPVGFLTISFFIGMGLVLLLYRRKMIKI